MTFLIEDPWPVIYLGVIAEAVLGVALWRTGRGIVLLVMLAVLLLAGGLVALEWYVVTERERVEQTIYAGAAALESNDPGRILGFLTPGNQSTERLVRLALGRIEFLEVTITHLDVGQIDRQLRPPSVDVHVIGFVMFRDKRGQIPYNSRSVDVELSLHQIDGRWQVDAHRWRKNQPPGMP